MKHTALMVFLGIIGSCLSASTLMASHSTLSTSQPENSTSLLLGSSNSNLRQWANPSPASDHATLTKKIKELDEGGYFEYYYEHGLIIRTPLLELVLIEELLGKKVFYKDDGVQAVGSFKLRGVLSEVEFEIEDHIERLIAGERPMGRPYYIVTQTTGNHGMALIRSVSYIVEKYLSMYREKYKEYFEEKYGVLAEARLDALGHSIELIQPKVFTMPKGIVPDVKLEGMLHEVTLFNQALGWQGLIDPIKNSIHDYNEASLERRKFVERLQGDGSQAQRHAAYMEHGGYNIMAGHASAGIEMVQQLEEYGITEDQTVLVIVPVGAGGPVGIIAGAKYGRAGTLGMIVQGEHFDAFIRTLQAEGEIQSNPKEPYLQALDSETQVIFGDGHAVDEPEREAVEVAMDIVDRAIAVSDDTTLTHAAPLLLASTRLGRSYQTVIGGTAALTLEALRQIKQEAWFSEVDVVVIYGPERNVDASITAHLESRIDQLDPRTIWEEPRFERLSLTSP